MGNDLPDYQLSVDVGTLEASSLVNGADAGKSAAPAVGDVYIATDTEIVYICVTAGSWFALNANISVGEPVRALNTSYQNTSDKIRVCCVSCLLDGVGEVTELEAFIGAADPPATKVADVRIDFSNEPRNGMVTFLVPPDYYYKVNDNGDDAHIIEWIEYDLL